MESGKEAAQHFQKAERKELSEFYTLWKYLLGTDEIKTISDEENLREFTSIKLSLREWLNKVIQLEKKL